MFNPLNYVGGTQLFLDDYPNAWGFAMQKIKGNYSGPVVELRRSTDNDLQNFYFDSNNKLSLSSQTSGGVSLSSWVGSNSAYLRTWYNQNTTGENWQQTLSGNQPRVVNSGVIETLNGEPAFFNASGNYLTFTSDWLASKRVIIFSIYNKPASFNQDINFSFIGGGYLQQDQPGNRSFQYPNIISGITFLTGNIIQGQVNLSNGSHFLQNNQTYSIAKVGSLYPYGKTYWLNRYSAGSYWNLSGHQNFQVLFNEDKFNFSDIQTQINDLYSIY